MTQNIIGKRIAGLLVEQGKTQRKLAKQVGTTGGVYIQVYQRLPGSEGYYSRQYCQGTAHHHGVKSRSCTL